MRRAHCLLAALGLSFAFATAVSAAPRVDARAYFVESPTTGEVLLARNAREAVPIASITKLMTVRVALKHLKPAQIVRVSAAAPAAGESTANLEPGERISVRDLVAAALIQSANDAADALADAAAHGDRPTFIRWMNEEARRLGLTSTHFVRPDGLDTPGHVSSARDVDRLARVVMHDPLVRSTVRMRTATISGGRRLSTWNDLLGTFPGLYGVKTGHTSQAGWCQVAVVRRPGFVVYATILGSPSRDRRNADLVELLRFGLSRYGLARVAASPVAYVPTQYGRPRLAVAPTEPLTALVRLDRPLRTQLVLPRRVSLPVRAGQRIGELRIFSNGRRVASAPLLATSSISRPGAPGRIQWYLGRTAHNLIGWL